MRVLLIEENPGDAKQIIDLLKGGSGEVEVSRVGGLQDAEKILSREPVDVVLLGLGTADVDRVLEAIPGNAVLLLTGSADEALIDRARRRGFEEVIRKDRVDATGLRKVLRHALARRHGTARFPQNALESLQRILSSVEKGSPADEVREDVRRALQLVEGLLKSGPEPAEPMTETARLLVTEDNRLVRELTVEVLRRNGYDVLSAASGQEALEVFVREGGRFDLLLTDCVMEEMNGRQLAEKIRASHPNLHVAFMSGYPQEDVIEQKAAEPARPFLQKPFGPDDLLETVRVALARTGSVGAPGRGA